MRKKSDTAKRVRKGVDCRVRAFLPVESRADGGHDQPAPLCRARRPGRALDRRLGAGAVRRGRSAPLPRAVPGARRPLAGVHPDAPDPEPPSDLAHPARHSGCRHAGQYAAVRAGDRRPDALLCAQRPPALHREAALAGAGPLPAGGGIPTRNTRPASCSRASPPCGAVARCRGCRPVSRPSPALRRTCASSARRTSSTAMGARSSHTATGAGRRTAASFRPACGGWSEAALLILTPSLGPACISRRPPGRRGLHWWPACR